MHQETRISTKAFVLRQISFIKTSVWLLSLLILLPAIGGAWFVGEDTTANLESPVILHIEDIGTSFAYRNSKNSCSSPILLFQAP